MIFPVNILMYMLWVMWVHTDKVGYYRIMEFYEFYHTKFTGPELIRKSMNPRKELFFCKFSRIYTTEYSAAFPRISFS